MLMERYNGVNPPYICSSCPKKTFGDCHSLLIHSVLAHDKSYVRELHHQASIIENSLVKEELEPVPFVQQNLKGSASSKKRKSGKTTPKSARKSPRLGPRTHLQVNFCQKHLFLHELTHNMTTDCSLNYKFSKYMLCTQMVFLF